MQIVPLRVTDRTNFMYVVIGEKNTVVLVDPFEVPKVKEFLSSQGIQPKRIISLTTHHHADHSAGNSHLENVFSRIIIYAGSRKAYTHQVCKDKDVIDLPDIYITCVHVPCHTEDSFAYFVQDKSSNKKGLFVGDTLFYLGCGKFFEGNSEMMKNSLEKLMGYPDDTVIYSGHEYKKKNLAFRKHILGKPIELEEGFFLTVKQERENNLFINTDLLAHLPEFKHLSSVERLALLREKKDRF